MWCTLHQYTTCTHAYTDIKAIMNCKLFHKYFVHHCKLTRSIVKLSSLSAEINLPQKKKRNYVVQTAEKVVGYPTSFLNLRWILNDEIANIVTQMKKLVGTNHPILKMAKNLLVQKEHLSLGLIVLLISKVAGLNSNFPDSAYDRTADILHSQRVIAEVTEMIQTGHLSHKSVVDIDPDNKDASTLNFGNTLALLCGDYLLSRSCNEVACLKNYLIQEIVATTLRDLAESEYFGLKSRENEPIPSKPVLQQTDVNIPFQLGVEPFEVEHVLGHMKAEWTLRNILGGGSLLGRSCQCALILANHDAGVQKLGYSFGRNLALAWKACLEKDAMEEEKFSLVSAPVMFHLECDPGFYKEIEKGLVAEGIIDYDTVRKTVMAGPGLEKTFNLQNHFSQLALDILEQFSNCEAKTALSNIIKAI